MLTFCVSRVILTVRFVENRIMSEKFNVAINGFLLGFASPALLFCPGFFSQKTDYSDKQVVDIYEDTLLEAYGIRRVKNDETKSTK